MTADFGQIDQKTEDQNCNEPGKRKFRKESS